MGWMSCRLPSDWGRKRFSTSPSPAANCSTPSPRRWRRLRADSSSSSGPVHGPRIGPMERGPVDADIAQQVIRPFLELQACRPAAGNEPRPDPLERSDQSAGCAIPALNTMGKPGHLGHFDTPSRSPSHNWLYADGEKNDLDRSVLQSDCQGESISQPYG